MKVGTFFLFLGIAHVHIKGGLRRRGEDISVPVPLFAVYSYRCTKYVTASVSRICFPLAFCMSTDY